MSLDLLKERFNVKHPTSEIESELEDKRKLIEDLEKKSINLNKEISSLKYENETLMAELNKFKQNEKSTVLIKEQEFNTQLEQKNSDILNLKLDIKSESIDKLSLSF